MIYTTGGGLVSGIAERPTNFQNDHSNHVHAIAIAAEAKSVKYESDIQQESSVSMIMMHKFTANITNDKQRKLLGNSHPLVVCVYQLFGWNLFGPAIGQRHIWGSQGTKSYNIRGPFY